MVKENNLNEFIKELTRQDNKTLSQKGLKVSEEAGELAKVILPFDSACSTNHRFVDKKNILEEVADIYLSAISVAYDLGFSDDEIEDMISYKAKKWADLQKRQSKINDKIPYEIHITVQNVNSDAFILACGKLSVKPIFLALQSKQKDVEDVMTSSVHMGNNRSAYEEMKRISNGLINAEMDVVREKIETAPWHPASPSNEQMEPFMPKDCYFETHMGVLVTKHTQSKLRCVAEEHNSHLSKNIFKINDNGSYVQMVTYRKYDGVVEEFNEFADKLYDAIINNGFEIDKIITEFAIYDTKNSHDFNWLK
jgi:NTP pyrophosphatase (non-canonical NTP hydrolase)